MLAASLDSGPPIDQTGSHIRFVHSYTTLRPRRPPVPPLRLSPRRLRMATRRMVINGDPGQFFLLAEGDTVTLGGGRPDAVSVLQGLRVVRISCELEVLGEQVTIRDDDGGAQGTPRPVPPGESVQAAGSRLCLEIGAGAPAAPTPAATPEQAAAPQRLAKRLRVIDGGNQGQLFPLPESGTVTLGKDRKHADIILNDLYVARIQCRLEIDGDKVVVVDAGAPGVLGTLVNGAKISRQEMGLGDILRVGNSHLRLEAAVPGEELTKGPGPGAREDAEEAIDVAQDEAGTGEDQWQVEEV